MTLVVILVVLFVAILFTFAIMKTYIPKPQTNDEFNEYSTRKAHNMNVGLKRVKFFVIIGYVVLLVIIGIATSVYSTNEQEIGFESVFGKNTMIEAPGIHFKTPFVSKKHIFDSTTKGMAIGYTESDDESVLQDSLMITSDFNFINIDFYLEYRITDPIEYYYCTNNPEGILENVAQSAIRNTVGRYDVDAVMTTGKTQIEIDVFEDVVKELEKHNTGLTVLNMTIQDSEPPTAEVAKAFKDVEDAKSDADTAVNNANSYTNTQIPAAEAKAQKILQDADATKTERINAAKEEVATFEALFSEYSNNPEVVKKRMYLDALSEILPKMEIIIDEDGQVIYLNGNAIKQPAASN